MRFRETKEISVNVSRKYCRLMRKSLLIFNQLCFIQHVRNMKSREKFDLMIFLWIGETSLIRWIIWAIWGFYFADLSDKKRQINIDISKLKSKKIEIEFDARPYFNQAGNEVNNNYLNAATHQIDYLCIFACFSF